MIVAWSSLAVEEVDTIDSTNAALLRREFGASPAAPAMLIAARQTAGRGRGGRAWVSDPSASLTFSVAFERFGDDARPLLGVPLAAGVAIAESLGALGAAQLRLKWPNDLLVAATSAKAGGILVEVRSQGRLQRVVVGCGLNLQPSSAIARDVPESVRAGAVPPQPVGALFIPGAAPPARELAMALGEALLRCWQRFAVGGFAPFADRWRALDALAGRDVALRLPDGTARLASAVGVDDDGALLVRIDGAISAVLSAEVSVRIAGAVAAVSPDAPSVAPDTAHSDVSAPVPSAARSGRRRRRRSD